MSRRKRDAATHTAQRACKIYVALISARGRVLIIHFLVTAHENTNVVGRRVWRFFSIKIVCVSCFFSFLIRHNKNSTSHTQKSLFRILLRSHHLLPNLPDLNLAGRRKSPGVTILFQVIALPRHHHIGKSENSIDLSLSPSRSRSNHNRINISIINV